MSAYEDAAERIEELKRIEAWAREYVHARYELRGADLMADALHGIARVDLAWHELTSAIGEHDPECASCYWLDMGATVETVHDEGGQL